MSQTYVVETVDGTWAMDCCDDLHSLADVVFMEFNDKRDAEAAARAHRAEDRIDRTAYEARIAGCCPTCGRAR